METMKWNNTKDKPIPKDGNLYLGIWKGAFCLLCWDEGFYMALNPADYTGSSEPLDEEAAMKIYYWAELDFPEDWKKP